MGGWCTKRGGYDLLYASLNYSSALIAGIKIYTPTDIINNTMELNITVNGAPIRSAVKPAKSDPNGIVEKNTKV